MSIRVMSSIWDLDLPDSEKLIALALADWCNDDGVCWPSVAQLATKASKSVRTVQAALASLEAKGVLERDMKPGKGVTYTLNPRNLRTPAKSAPPQRTTRTPAAAADNTSIHTIPQKASPSSVSRERADPGSYHRLPEGWVPTRPLPPATQAKVSQWPPGKFDDELAALHRWAANASNEKGKGRKLNWDMAFVNWLEKADNDWRSRNGPHQSNPAASFRGSRPSPALALKRIGDAELAAERAATGQEADWRAWSSLPALGSG